MEWAHLAQLDPHWGQVCAQLDPPGMPLGPIALVVLKLGSIGDKWAPIGTQLEPNWAQTLFSNMIFCYWVMGLVVQNDGFAATLRTNLQIKILIRSLAILGHKLS